MKNGVGAFNKAASTQYRLLNESEKKKLNDLSATSSKQMSMKEVHKAAAKILKQLRTRYMHNQSNIM